MKIHLLSNISKNPNAINILEKGILLDWRFISENPNAIHLIEQNFDKICWDYLSFNPNALHLLESNLDKIYWYGLAKNTNIKAIKLLEDNIDKFINIESAWRALSSNPNAIHILEKHYDKIHWYYFAQNTNIKAIKLLEDNINKFINDKIVWKALSLNPNAIYILEKNLNKVDWICLSQNSNAIHLITKLNYDKMKENMSEFNEELVAKVFNPNRLLKICENYNINFIEIQEIY